MIERVGIAASRGEIRAVNQLLYHSEEMGIKVTDDVFKEIMKQLDGRVEYIRYKKI